MRSVNTLISKTDKLKNRKLKNLGVEDFPTPHWKPKINSKITKIETKWIPFSDIYIDDINHNVRKDGLDKSKVETIEKSMGQDIDTQQFPPAVVPRPSNNKNYQALYGFHRMHALLNLGYTGYYFTVYHTTDRLTKHRIQSIENEQLPKYISSLEEVANGIVRSIHEKLLKNTEKVIWDEIEIRAEYRPKEVKTKIFELVRRLCGTKNTSPFISYTNKKYKLWMENHSNSEDYTTSGELDTFRGMHGMLCPEGYEKRKIWSALENYKETGLKTYFVVHVNPSKTQSHMDKRKKFLKSIDSIRSLCEFYGMQEFPVIIEGFLPQVKDTENIKKLITPSEVINS